MIEICTTSTVPEDVASTSATVALLAEYQRDLSTNCSTSPSEEHPRWPASEVASSKLHSAKAEESLSRFKELLSSALVGEAPPVVHSSGSLGTNRTFLFSSRTLFNSSSVASSDVAPSGSKASNAPTTRRVDESTVTLEACVRRPSGTSCGICKTHHQPSKVESPRTSLSDQNDSNTPVRKRLEIANIAVCSTYTLWKFHRLKFQQCGRQTDATKSATARDSIQENGRAELSLPVEECGALRNCVSPPTANAPAENVRNNGGTWTGLSRVSFLSSEASSILNQTVEQSEMDVTVSRLNPNVSEQNLEQCPRGDDGQLLPICFLTCQRAVKSSKLFKKRRKCLTLRLRIATTASALFHFSTNNENYQQFSEFTLVNSCNRRSLIVHPPHCSNSILRVIYLKLICCQPNGDSSVCTSSRTIPVLITCGKDGVLTLAKPVFTKTYNCSYSRRCYRQKYTRRKRGVSAQSGRTLTRSTADSRTRDDVIKVNRSTRESAASCLQPSNTLRVPASLHGHSRTPCSCFNEVGRNESSSDLDTCRTVSPPESRTQSDSLWHTVAGSWLSAILVVILTPILIVLSLICRKLWRSASSGVKSRAAPNVSKAFQKSKFARTIRSRKNDFLQSFLCLLVVFVCCVPRDSSSALASSFPLDPQRFVRSAPAFEDDYNRTDNPRGRICQSIDVRNSVHNLRLLRRCRVIEGFLQIFVETGSPAEWGNYTFPELVEVTDYVLMYRNTGLRALGELFPNLALIRGRNLLYNYALVVYESTGIQELGLYHLTDIVRGSVLIMKNPTLCFVDTVDWDLISWTKGGHYIKDNRHPNECPICPLNATGGELCMPSNATPASRPLCVNTTHCQKTCKVECEGRSCYQEGLSCCNPACIGGCTGNSSSDCIGCRHLEFQGTCVEKCPSTSYSFLERRCVSNDECQAQPPPITAVEVPVKYWKFVRNEFTGDNVCVLDCPKGYVEQEIPDGPQRSKFECQRCYGDCEKKCQGSNIESIQKLQEYKECTYIKGSLEIQIQNGANVVKELEDNLGMVEVIEGYLKIARSYPVMSLNFFKKLRLIMGETLETNRFALVVLDNQNLMELWDWSKRNVSLEIRQGTIFFHFNPKLCYYHIENLATRAGLTSITETEVPKSSNGDKAACNITKINSTICALSYGVAQISWEKFNHYDSRALLSYLIFYKETKFQNVTIYDGRDACGGDGWKMEDFENIENKASSLTDGNSDDKWIYHIMTGLKPFTQYAYYVRTYTIATERNGAQSPIQYFYTKPFTPSFPLDLIATTLSSSEIEISWKPPKTPNGNVTHYFIVGYWERDDPKIIQSRNYCREPIILSGGGTLVSRTSTPAPSTVSSTDSTQAAAGAGSLFTKSTTGLDDECVCDKKDEKSEEDKMKETNRWIEIEFENSLQNQVYVKRPMPINLYASDSSRRRREVEGAENIFPDVKQTNQLIRVGSEEENQTFVTVPSPAGNVTTRDGVFERFEFVVYGATSFVLRNLSHYAKYNIEVQACREVVPDEIFDSQNQNCSRKSLVTRRTAARDGVDSINQTSFRLERSNGSWFAVWEAPPSPNGLVVAYRIETARQDKSKYSAPDPHCISKLQYDLDGRYDIQSSELLAGNYSIRVRAVSLHGEGAWSEKLYFVVQKPGMSNLELGIIIVLFLMILLLISLGVVYYRREKKAGARLNPSVNPEYIPVYKKDSWEVARSKVTILDELGNGSFGLVCRGIVKDFRSLEELPCAVKLVNENASDRERAEFLNEASVMKAFDAHHVVKLFGVVSEGHPTLVIMELMAGGDLKNYLRSCRPDAEVDLGRSPPTLKRILQMAAEIADGMAYLADKKYVHRDLAARNCMVADDLTVKVGDFGMTRDIYETEYYRKGSRGFLPVRWMAPESLKDGVFTSCSDVWSYGVVLWEIATLASQPYQGLTNEQVLNWVKGGGILVRPDNCPDRLFSLMRRCWQFKPSARPTFMLLLADLDRDQGDAFRAVSYYHSDAAKEHKLRLASKAETRTSSTTLDEHIPLRSAEDIEDFSLSSDSSEEEDNIHHAPSGYTAENDDTPGLQLESCATPRESNTHAKPRNDGGFRNRNSNGGGRSKHDGYSDMATSSGAFSQPKSLGRYMDDDSRYPESKNSTIGRYSEDSRGYLDSSRTSTLGRSEEGRYAREGSSDRLDRERRSYGTDDFIPGGNSNDKDSEKERLVSGDSNRRVSISRQSPAHAASLVASSSPTRNYSLMTPASQSGNAANGLSVLAGSGASAGNAATSTAATAEAPLSSALPSYVGGRFSSLGNSGGFRSSAANSPRSIPTTVSQQERSIPKSGNASGPTSHLANSIPADANSGGPTGGGVTLADVSWADSAAGVGSGATSTGLSSAGASATSLAGVTALGGAANGHVTGGGAMSNNNNNHRRRNNGGPASSSQTSMPC